MRIQRFFLIGSFFLLFGGNLFGETYTVETSQGERDVVLPEAMTPIEGFLQMAELYLEERYDLEEALTQVDQLLEHVDRLVSEVTEYQTEVIQYREHVAELEERYREETALLPLSLSIGGWVDTQLPVLSPSVGASVFLDIYERARIWISGGFPYRLGIGIGWRLF
jgi:hypothetical protein